jgi:hypothetical protein
LTRDFLSGLLIGDLKVLVVSAGLGKFRVIIGFQMIQMVLQENIAPQLVKRNVAHLII